VSTGGDVTIDEDTELLKGDGAISEGGRKLLMVDGE
jgi:hypothetical protein